MDKETKKNISATISDAIIMALKEQSRIASFDKTKKGIISSVVDSTTVKVMIYNTEYTIKVSSSTGLSTGMTVRVVIPENNWNDMFIIKTQ